MKKITFLIAVITLVGVNLEIFAQWQTNGDNLYYLDGNVGIGTENPLNSNASSGLGKTLHLKSNTTSSLILENTSGKIFELCSTDGSNFGIYDKTNGLYNFLVNNDGNVGIGTYSSGNQITSKLHLLSGNIHLNEEGAGIILTSPDGSEWKITVDNSGNLSANQYTRIKETKKESDVNIYPNPSTENITIDLGGIANANVTVELYDISGKMVFMRNYTQTDNIVLNLSGYKAGNYIAKIRTKNGEVVKTKKIIKE